MTAIALQMYSILNSVSKKLAVHTFLLIALEGKKVWLKVIPRWKDDSEWKKTKLRNFSKHSKMKMKKMTKIFKIYFSETLNFAHFKYVFRFFIYFFHQKLQPFKAGPFCLFLPVFDHFKPILEYAVTLDRRKI